MTEPIYDCGRCHTSTDFDIKEFDHEKLTRFALVGKHREVECEQCHPTETLSNGKTAVRYRLPYGECDDCHGNPHVSEGSQSGRQEKNAKKDTKGGDGNCTACHTPVSWRKIRIAGRALGEGKFEHADTGFPLTGKHRRIRCASCHQDGARPNRACRSCHDQAHGGTFYTDCERCHSSGEPSLARAIEIHATTRLPLTGKHLLADCTECHRQTGGLQWRSVPSDCFSCHYEQYYSKATHPPHAGTNTEAPYPRNCAECHRTTGWSPAVVPVQEPRFANRRSALVSPPRDHDLRFPITHGVHRGLPCRNCHISQARPRLVRCTGCHAHSPTRLARQHERVRVPVGRLSCLSCHRGGAVR